jgi:hypothetical protein
LKFQIQYISLLFRIQFFLNKHTTSPLSILYKIFAPLTISLTTIRQPFGNYSATFRQPYSCSTTK